jgi:hypothetical protein
MKKKAKGGKKTAKHYAKMAMGPKKLNEVMKLAPVEMKSQIMRELSQMKKGKKNAK